MVLIILKVERVILVERVNILAQSAVHWLKAVVFVSLVRSASTVLKQGPHRYQTAWTVDLAPTRMLYTRGLANHANLGLTRLPLVPAALIRAGHASLANINPVLGACIASLAPRGHILTGLDTLHVFHANLVTTRTSPARPLAKAAQQAHI